MSTSIRGAGAAFRNMLFISLVPGAHNLHINEDSETTHEDSDGSESSESSPPTMPFTAQAATASDYLESDSDDSESLPSYPFTASDKTANSAKDAFVERDAPASSRNNVSFQSLLSANTRSNADISLHT